MGAAIIQVEAQDADTGPNGDVHFRLKQDLAGHWRTFDIQEKSGLVTLKLPLDREIQKLYEVHLHIYFVFLCAFIHYSKFIFVNPISILIKN